MLHAAWRASGARLRSPLAKRGERAGAAAVNKSPVALRAQLLRERCDRSVRNSQKDDLIGGGGELPWVSGATPKRADKN